MRQMTTTHIPILVINFVLEEQSRDFAKIKLSSMIVQMAQRAHKKIAIVSILLYIKVLIRVFYSVRHTEINVNRFFDI